MAGKSLRRKSGDTTVTNQAPASEASMATRAAGSNAGQGRLTRRLYCQVAIPVPQTEAPLLVPNSVAGCAVGNVANKVGTRIKPPPPTIESTKPANSEARVTTSISMPGLSHPTFLAAPTLVTACTALPPQGVNPA